MILLTLITRHLDSRDAVLAWPSGILHRTLLFRLALRPYVIGLLAFFFYWLVPLTINFYQNTLIPHDFWIAHASKLQRLGIDSHTLSILLPTYSTGRLTTGYLNDNSHFLFSIVLFIAAIVATSIYQRYHSVILKLRDDHVINCDEKYLLSLYNSYRSVANHTLFRLLSLALAVLAFFFFIRFFLLAQYDHWWGNVEFGYSGIYMSISVSLMTYYGTQVMIHLIIGSLMYERILREGLQPRLFHADRCNGLLPLGNLIFLSWLLALLLAAAITITIFLGYLGIEKQIFVWVLAVLGLITIPSIAIVPLAASTLALHRIKRSKLSDLETMLQSMFEDLEQHIKHHRADDALAIVDKISKLRGAYDVVYKMNMWPFNTKALGLVISIYAGQMSLTLGKFILG